jgi:hypothetical protein
VNIRKEGTNDFFHGDLRRKKKKTMSNLSNGVFCAKIIARVIVS